MMMRQLDLLQTNGAIDADREDRRKVESQP
jgi:hypothetical protein